LSLKKGIKNLKKVIINADDLFLDKEINRGIGELIDIGIVTSVSVIVNLEYNKKDFYNFHKNHPNASYGIHINLTNGVPITQHSSVYSIIDNTGIFYDTKKFIYRILLMNVKHLRREISSQICRFIDSGVPLSHIDSHDHIFWISGKMRKLQIEFASKYRIPVRCPVVTDIENKTFLFFILKLYLRIHKNVLRRYIRMPGNLIDIFGSNSKKSSIMKNLLMVNDGISEILTHPGYSYKRKFKHREREIEILKSLWFTNLLKSYNIVLTNFYDV